MSKKKKKKKFKKHKFIHQNAFVSLETGQKQTILKGELEAASEKGKKESVSRSTWEPPSYIRSDLKRISIWTISLVILLFFVYYLSLYTDLFRSILDWIKV